MSRTQLFDLDGKIAFVSGASRGIGEAIARLLAQQGAHVIVSSRKLEGCQPVADAIIAEGGKATAIACHIGEMEQITQTFARIRADFGRIDILVNNAATNPQFCNVLDTDLGAFQKTVDVNIRGYFFMSVEAGKLMREHGTWYVPTIIAGKYVEEKADIPGYYPPQVAAKAKQVGPIIQQTAGRAYRAGVKIAFGTDAAVYPHGENAKEFAYMVEAGMPPAYALQAATTHAAELLKKSRDLGSVEAGKFADIIAVHGDPLQDIAVMQKVDFVMKAGTVYRERGHEVAP